MLFHVINRCSSSQNRKEKYVSTNVNEKNRTSVLLLKFGTRLTKQAFKIPPGYFEEIRG